MARKKRLHGPLDALDLPECRSIPHDSCRRGGRVASGTCTGSGSRERSGWEEGQGEAGAGFSADMHPAEALTSFATPRLHSLEELLQRLLFVGIEAVPPDAVS